MWVRTPQQTEIFFRHRLDVGLYTFNKNEVYSNFVLKVCCLAMANLLETFCYLGRLFTAILGRSACEPRYPAVHITKPFFKRGFKIKSKAQKLAYVSLVTILLFRKYEYVKKHVHNTYDINGVCIAVTCQKLILLSLSFRS